MDSTVPSAGDAPSQCLTFQLGAEVFAMDIRTVREIIQHGSMTTVPLMPAFVRGVINLRGAIVPVIDLHARFGRPPATITRRSCIVIFEAVNGPRGERADLGLLVDAVSEVVEIPPAAVEPPPQFGAAIRREFISGIGKLGHRFVVLLDPGRTFDIEDMAALCETSTAALAA